MSERPQVIALLFGPEGLSEGKIESLVTHNRDLLRELADYAEQSSQVESLVQQLANAEESGRSAAVLKGFSSQFGVDAPKLDTKASSDQQAALLLKALLAASTAYDPLAGRGTQVQQSGGTDWSRFPVSQNRFTEILFARRQADRRRLHFSRERASRPEGYGHCLHRHGHARFVWLLLAQSDGIGHEVPVTVFPPNPRISNIPIRLNLGDAYESLHLEGSGLDRVEAVSSDAGEITGAPDVHGWSGEIALKPTLKKGQRLALTLKIHRLENPLSIPDAIEIVGPRPRIVSMQKSLAGTPGLEIGADELPAGTAAGLVLTVGHLKEGRRPRVDLSCQTGEVRQPLALSPGEISGGASLAFAGAGALYLSVDPGAVGYAGCALTATVSLDPEGRSDAFVLGRVMRIPRDKFTLSGEKVGDSSYAGSLEGRDLDVIEKVGWDAMHGVTVESIPTPVPGDPARQTLRVVLPWPAPAPHAPLHEWLRGEPVGRKTTVGY